MSGLTAAQSLEQTLGLLRSLAMYYGQPWKLSRMRRLGARWLGEGSLAFDVGAHVGNRIGAWRRLGARVVAFEPQPSCRRFLEWRYGTDRDVLVLPYGLGAAEGHAILNVSSRTPTVSTLSTDWIAEVRQDERFGSIHWDRAIQVQVSTLDAMIERFGAPDFCKIDVEGFELEVLQGLSRPLPALSFEFIPVSAARALACVDRLETLGAYRFNWSLRESHRLQSEAWLTAAQIREVLVSRPLLSPSGDVYAVNPVGA